jgi:hypothetical protein
MAIAAAAAPAASAAPQAAETPSPTTSGQKQATPDPQKLQTFGIGPANAKGLDRRPAYIYVAKPGTVIKERVALLNYTFKPLKVRVYASDAFTAEGGAFDVLPAATKPTDAGAWTSLKPRTVTLPARSSKAGAPPSQLVIPFRISVPKAAEPGDHAAGIVASTSTDDVAAAGAAGAAGIVVDRRVGTRIYMRVTGPLDPRLEVTDLTASYDHSWNPVGAGTVEVSYRVRNTGNVALSAAQAVRVSGWFGASASAAPLPDLVQVLPGSSVMVSTVVEGVLPTIRGTVAVDLTPYNETGQARERFASSSTGVGLWLIPWALLIAIAVITAAVWTYRARGRRGSVPPQDEPDAVQPELVDA